MAAFRCTVCGNITVGTLVGEPRCQCGAAMVDLSGGRANQPEKAGPLAPNCVGNPCAGWIELAQHVGRLSSQSLGTDLTAALIGGDREPEVIHQLSRLAWLKTLISDCERTEVMELLSGEDPDAFWTMVREIKALLADASAALVKHGVLTHPLV